MLTPSLGVPQQVIAPQRKRRLRMDQADFYNQQMEAATPAPQMYQPPASSSVTANSVDPQSMEGRFQQGPVTGDYLKQQLTQYAQRTAPPSLEPGARVTSPNMELVQPSNFQQFYE